MARPIHKLLILIGAFTFAACTMMNSGEMLRYQRENLAWDLVCEIKNVDCTDIPQPGVIYSPNVGWGGNYGEYLEGPWVVLDDDLATDPDAIIVIVHEFVHYLQVYRNEVPRPRTWEQKCGAEEEAFTVAAEAARRLGLTESKLYVEWPRMQLQYGCHPRR